MGFEALSCAIARVIIHYHAYRTHTTAPKIDDEHSLESILKCTTKEINTIIKAKITQATTGNNSSRLTLLQYMHFGLSLSEKARVMDNADEIKAITPALIQFIQNLQRLLTTTSFFSRTLSMPIGDNQHLLTGKSQPSSRQAAVLTYDEDDEIDDTASWESMSFTATDLTLEHQQLIIEKGQLEQEYKTLQEKIQTLQALITKSSSQAQTHAAYPTMGLLATLFLGFDYDVPDTPMAKGTKFN